MPDYGVTDKGFVLKRMDTILEEIHTDLTEGFGVDTRPHRPSFLDVLVTSFAGQIADLWETAQDDFYSKYPATATGLNLDNAVQYGGIRRAPDRRTVYPLHCTGEDGTVIREETMVATDTNPEVRLYAPEEFQIVRESFNAVDVVVAVPAVALYTVTVNGKQYSYTSSTGMEPEIINGLKEAIADPQYKVTVENGSILRIEDTVRSRNNVLALSDNLTTAEVTTVAQFLTEDYGKITLPYGIVTKMVNNITGFERVTNILKPTYGRLAETDVELRQSYIAKSALRSNTMIDSIVSELLNNIADVESASGYENSKDYTDERGLPPHSIEIIAEGGDDTQIAQAILRRKAGGIQTFGSIVVDVPGNYGDSIPVRFNRPEYLYTWLKLVLHGDAAKIPSNYAQLVKESVVKDGSRLVAGTSLLTQLLTEGIYDAVAGITFIEIYTAYSKDAAYIPSDGEYVQKNVVATTRQKVLVDELRIEVMFCADL